MHYTYVLLSQADQRFYIGATQDLKRRLEEHQAGRVGSTAYRRPLKLLYYEACLSAEDAYRRERYLKSGRGGRYIKQRLSSSLADVSPDPTETRRDCRIGVRGDKLERH